MRGGEQATIKTNDDSVQWRIYVALRGAELVYL